VAHPPEIPNEAVIVAGAARKRVAEMKRERPGPRDGQRREADQRAEVSDWFRDEILR